MTENDNDKIIQLMYETIKSLADAEKAKSELELKQAELKITMANLEMCRMVGNTGSGENADVNWGHLSDEDFIQNSESSNKDTNKILYHNVRYIQYEKGYKYIEGAPAETVTLDDAFVWLNDTSVCNPEIIFALYDSIEKMGKSLFIISPTLDEDSMRKIWEFRDQKKAKIYVGEVPFFGDRRKEFLYDLAAFTDAIYNHEIKSTGDLTASIGHAEHIIISQDKTTIINGRGKADRVNNRIASIKREIEDSISDYDKEKMQERVDILSACLKVRDLYFSAAADYNEWIIHQYWDDRVGYTLNGSKR